MKDIRRSLRAKQVAQRLGCSDRTVWRLSKTDPGFPKPFNPTPGTAAWDEVEVEAYVRSRRNTGSGPAPAEAS